MTDISKEAIEKLADDLMENAAIDSAEGCNPDVVALEENAATTIRAQAARIEELQSSQAYTYIGKDGKSVLARDLEDERDALKARIEELEAQCMTVKPLEWRDGGSAEAPKRTREGYWVDSRVHNYAVLSARGYPDRKFEGDDAKGRAIRCAEEMHQKYILSQSNTQSADDVWDAAIEAAAEVCEAIAQDMQTTGDRKRYTALQATWVGKDFARMCRDDVCALKRNKGTQDDQR